MDERWRGRAAFENQVQLGAMGKTWIDRSVGRGVPVYLSAVFWLCDFGRVDEVESTREVAMLSKRMRKR
jgi:hypothetical protein